MDIKMIIKLGILVKNSISIRNKPLDIYECPKEIPFPQLEFGFLRGFLR